MPTPASGARSTAPLDVASSEGISTATRYSSAATSVDTRDLFRLQILGGHLDDELAAKTAVHRDAVTIRDDLFERRDQLAGHVRDAQKVLSAAGAVPVMGSTQLNARQMAGWFRTTGATPRLAPFTTIDDIAALYIDEGAAEDVRGDFAFAQAIIETGSFTVAAGNNYSGIGVCDSCTGGYVFATPRDGVRAQIQLLRNYADPTARREARAPALARVCTAPTPRRRRASTTPSS